MLAIFLDQETTGLDPMQHKVIEVAFKIVDLTCYRVLESYQSIIHITKEDWNQKDPFSVEVNGFTWDKFDNAKEISLVRQEIIDVFFKHSVKRGECVFICQNPSFDRPFFLQIIESSIHEKNQWPYHWLDLASMFWTKRMIQCAGAIPEKMSLSKDSIAEWYGLPKEAKPHAAMNGVDHLMRCYQAVFLQESS